MNSISIVDQQFIEQLTQVVEENLDKENFSVEELAKQLGMSRSTLHRKVKSVIKKSVSEFIRETRLEHAHKLLQNKAGSVSEIAYKVGFSSVPYFNRCFHKHYGYTPGEVAKGKHFWDETPDQVTIKTKKRRIKSYYFLATILFFLICASLIFVWIKEPAHKTSSKNIAVFPVHLDKSSENFSDEIQWITIEIIDHLHQISNLSVVPFSSIQNYSSEKKKVKKMGKELLVDYILFSNLSLLNNQIKIHFELLNVSSDSAVWSQIYSVKSDSTVFGKTFTLEENIALKVADQLNLNLSNPEKKQIEKVLSKNTEAVDYYQLARSKFSAPVIELSEMKQIKKMAENALKLDSTFSEAYSLLGRIYFQYLRYTPDIYLAERYMDSSVIYNQKALVYNKMNQDAISGLYEYYSEKGMHKKAAELEPLMIHREVKNYLFYLHECDKYAKISDFYNLISSFYSYLELKPDDEIIPWGRLENIFSAFNDMGFPEEAQFYSDKKNLLRFQNLPDEDSFETLLIDEFNGNYEKGYQRAQRMLKNNDWIQPGENFYLVRYWERKGDFKAACEYLDKLESVMGPDGENWLEMLSNKSRLVYPFGYCYLKTGQEEKANYYFKRLIKKYSDEIELNAYFARKYYSFLEIAMVYSAMNKKDEALKNLKEIRKMKACPLWFILELKNSPWFENIRETKEYKNLIRDFEKSYQREHTQIARLVERYEKEII